MSRAQHLPAEHGLQQRCAQLGVPLTLQRRAIYNALAERDDHPTADELFAALQRTSPGISKATAYRTLDKLVELGLVRRVSHPGAVARFDAKTHRHHHLVCERCGAVADLECGSFDALRVPDVHGFRVRDYSVHIHGLCAQCASSRTAASGHAAALGNGSKGRSRPAGRQAARAPASSRPRRKP